MIFSNIHPRPILECRANLLEVACLMASGSGHLERPGRFGLDPGFLPTPWPCLKVCIRPTASVHPCSTLLLLLSRTRNLSGRFGQSCKRDSSIPKPSREDLYHEFSDSLLGESSLQYNAPQPRLVLAPIPPKLAQAQTAASTSRDKLCG